MKNKNRGSIVNYLGYLFGIITLVIVLFSLVFITKHRPISRIRTFSLKKWEKIEKEFTAKGWVTEEDEETIEESFKTLSVKNITGDIEITGWDEDYFQIKYVKAGTTKEQVDKLAPFPPIALTGQESSCHYHHILQGVPTPSSLTLPFPATAQEP